MHPSTQFLALFISLWRSMVFVGVCLVGFSTATSTGAATIPVYNTNDAFAGSLRQAIQDANNVPGDNTIVFQIPASGPGYDAATNSWTITLSSVPSLAIAKNLTIDAGTSKIVVTRVTNSGGIFFVSAGTVNISNLTLSNSSATGLINTGGTVTVRNCLFRDNRGTVTDPGGILNYSAGGTVNVINCTFFGNTEGTIGNSGTLSLTNSTLVGTSAAAPVISSFSGTTRVRNNIIVGNGSAASGNFISEGYNMVGTISGSGFGSTGDQIGVSMAQANLGPLQDNGGLTKTMRPNMPSPAIDQGNRGLDNLGQPINSDQRRQLKPVDLGIPNAVGGDGSDIGAVELGLPQTGPTFTVTNTAEHDDSGCTTDDCTLLEALYVSNAHADANVINFAAGVVGSIYPLNSGGLPIVNPVTINGPGARTLTINGSGISRSFGVSSGNVSISGLTIANGYATAPGGAGFYVISGDLTLTDCAVKSNFAANANGGGLYIASGATVTLNRTTLEGNFASALGGAIYSNGIVTATNCTFYACNAVNGGGIFSEFNSGNSRLTLRNCTITHCNASDPATANGSGGGGIYAFGGSTQYHLGNTLIAGNTSESSPQTNPDLRGNFTSDGHNFIGDPGHSTLVTTGVTGDQIGTIGMPIDPMLDLATPGNHGGPTDTLALLSGSTAIDAGDNALAPTTDQRGYFRSGVSDIGAFEFNGPPPPAVPLVNVVSSKVHGAQTFGINLPLTGNPGVECRSGGANGDFTVIYTFTNPLTYVGAAGLTIGTGNVSSSGIGTDSHQYIINLTNVNNEQTLTLNLINVTDSLGNNSNAIPVAMGVLMGDTNGSGAVSASDIGQTKAQSGQTATGTNFRTDVNVSGSISASDIGLVKAKSGTSVP